ncbi:MAG: DUF72 domain-containing protein [Gammaproteobacteria bacterium]
MRLLAGTSGYAFKEWKGSFYPADIKADGMLTHYATRFPTVEINNTFYRMPRENVLQDWASQVPETFTFAIKASQRITHHARLRPESKELLGYLLQNTTVLGSKLGPVLFQLPPNMKKDIDRLRTFLDFLPHGRKFTFEFRHSSWFDEDVVDALRAKDAALTIIDQDDFATPPIASASWGYLRLHKLDYDANALTEWAGRVKEQPWSEAYVYFKHDEGVGSGPPAVDAFTKILETS